MCVRSSRCEPVAVACDHQIDHLQVLARRVDELAGCGELLEAERPRTSARSSPTIVTSCRFSHREERQVELPVVVEVAEEILVDRGVDDPLGDRAERLQGLTSDRTAATSRRRRDISKQHGSR